MIVVFFLSTLLVIVGFVVVFLLVTSGIRLIDWGRNRGYAVVFAGIVLAAALVTYVVWAVTW